MHKTWKCGKTTRNFITAGNDDSICGGLRLQCTTVDWQYCNILQDVKQLTGLRRC